MREENRQNTPVGEPALARLTPEAAEAAQEAIAAAGGHEVFFAGARLRARP